MRLKNLLKASVHRIFLYLLYPAALIATGYPAYIRYSDEDVPEPFAGVAIDAWVYIRQSYKNDLPLLTHELTHVRQYWKAVKNGCSHSYRYNNDNQYKLDCEVEAYREQLREIGNMDRADLFAGFIATRYNLGITAEDAKNLILYERR